MPSEEPPTVEEAYAKLAPTYESQETDPYCADLEFPAMNGLIPDVTGQRILDAGCGHGRYADWLCDQGADVVAVDSNEAMLEQARRRLGNRATVRHGDLTESLPFAEDTFDGIVSGLSLHYVEDWRVPFAEFARLLRPGGFLTFSTHHPVDEYTAFEPTNYFAIEKQHMTWSAGESEVDVPFYRRPFDEVITPLLETGFRLDELVEPTPRESFADKNPDSYEKRLRHPTFLCVRARTTAC